MALTAQQTLGQPQARDMTNTNTTEELAKFGALADRWWDTDGAMRPLHDINPLRLDYIDERGQLDGARVLDIGCGAGILSEAMARRGATVTGLDLSEPLIEAARAHAAESGLNIDYQLVASRDLAADMAGQFDIVICMEMLEHVDEPDTIVDDCAQLVTPGGAVFFSTLNRTLKARVLAIGGAEYVLGLLPKGTHDFDKFIKPSELAGWARHSGLDVHAIDGMRYNPFTHHAALESSPDVNYFMYTTRPDNPQ